MMALRLFLTFAKIGLFTFGGGYAMIPLIQKEIIQAHAWLTMKEFVDIIAIAEMTPGPVAVNSATFVGYKLAGVPGAAAATGGVIFPSFVIVVAFATLFLKFKDAPAVKAVLMGIRPAVTALIAAAAISLVKASFVDIAGPIIAALVLIGMFRLDLNPILAIVLAGIVGVFLY
ncbi:MAG: chromate transporter [Firmicutes bacterium]|nr:chromate transporter [Bacillota bacterium]